MTHVTRLCAAVLLLAGVTALRSQTKDEKPFNDADFVKIAASAGMHEVEISKLAQTKARNDAVKKFAETLVNDHTKINDALKAAAKDANIPVPDKLLDEHQKEVDMFREYKGTNFDVDFVKHQVKDHEQAVALFTRATKEAKNEKIKDFATKYLPTLQSHLEQAKKLQP